MRALSLLLLVVAVVGCGDDAGRSDSGGDEDGETGGGEGAAGPGPAACASEDFQAEAIAFCEKQFPSEPAPGQLGASCTDDGQCDSQVCLEPFGSAAYCSLECPQGDECSVGFSCQDTGAGYSACYQGVCIYGAGSKSECVTDLLEEVDRACEPDGCTEATVRGWVDCLAASERLCSTVDADDACGAQRGLIDSCCVGCNDQSW